MSEKGSSAAPKKGAAKSKAGAAKSVPPPAPAAAKPRGTGPEVSVTEAQKGHTFRRRMIGVITSDKMDKTVVVEVIRKAMDPMYKKYIRVRDRYKAHDAQNQFRVGDRVEITEHRPISRDKRWLVTRLVARRVEA